MDVRAVDIGLVRADDRIRSVTPEAVESLAASIAEVGLLNPITVFEREVIQSGNKVPGYGLIAGAHRLKACKRLGMAEINVVVVNLGEQERVIAECDENLCGTKLTPAEAATFTARRKAAYLVLHPDTENGRNQHSGRVGQLVQPSFADDQSEKTGVDARTVRRQAERGEKISPAAMAMVKGTKLDTGAYLDRLKSTPAGDQAARVRADLEAAERKPKPVRIAADPTNDLEAQEAQVAALMAAWNRAGKDARDEFMRRVDVAVMDRRYSA